MNKRLILFCSLYLLSCNDDSIVSSIETIQDAGPLRINNYDLAPPDSEIDSRVIQARRIPEIDALVPDAETIVCEFHQHRRPCILDEFLGPCAEGEQSCNITYWSQCFQINFPRMEVCDGIDNDCDGSTDEDEYSQNDLLARSCYTGPPATIKNPPCKSGTSICQLLEQVEDEWTGEITNIYGYGECIDEVTPVDEVCDNIDNDCDGPIDEGFTICECRGDQELPEETCNLVDDDCDERIDEGFFPCETICETGQAVCLDGLLADCTAQQPVEEVCDFQDNDCDGDTDEGQRNVCDGCGPVPPDECDGLDNDCDGTVDENLLRECQTECELGFETCTEGNWISCTARQPVEEGNICNGEDDDCDGVVDEGLDCSCTIQDVGVLIPCSEPPLVCGQGFKTCECVDEECSALTMSDCQAICAYLPQNQGPCDTRFGMALQNELCNNFDEDCDESIDEGVTSPCYTGPENTAGVGVCLPGEMICKEGVWGNWEEVDVFTRNYCLGEVTPQEEVCDGADNDCDGEVDYGEEIADTDILFIVDWSGSMVEEIEAVKVALNRFATQFQAENQLQWGLIVGPKDTPAIHENLILVSNISPFAVFLNRFAQLGNEGMDTGSEMLLDAMYLAVQNVTANNNFDVAAARWVGNGTGSTPEKENFTINWRQGARKIIIVFSDEEPQTYLDPSMRIATVRDAMIGTPDLKLYTFSGGMGNADWTRLANAANGINFELTMNQNQMYENLMSIIDEACLP